MTVQLPPVPRDPPASTVWAPSPASAHLDAQVQMEGMVERHGGPATSKVQKKARNQSPMVPSAKSYQQSLHRSKSTPS